MKLAVLSTDHWPVIALQLLGCIPTATPLPCCLLLAPSPSLYCFVFPFYPNSPRQTSLQSLALLKAERLENPLISLDVCTGKLCKNKVGTFKIEWTHCNYKTMMRCLFVQGDSVPASRRLQKSPHLAWWSNLCRVLFFWPFLLRIIHAALFSAVLAGSLSVRHLSLF